MKPGLDCIYNSPIDLAQIGIPFGAKPERTFVLLKKKSKSMGKV